MVLYLRDESRVGVDILRRATSEATNCDSRMTGCARGESVAGWPHAAARPAGDLPGIESEMVETTHVLLSRKIQNATRYRLVIERRPVAARRRVGA